MMYGVTSLFRNGTGRVAKIQIFGIYCAVVPLILKDSAFSYREEIIVKMFENGKFYFNFATSLFNLKIYL